MLSLTLLLALVSPLLPAAPASGGDPVAVASGVLHAWDARRARAWAEVDAVALRGLYVRGSPAGAADLALLRRYAARGLVVRRQPTQYLALTVDHLGPTSIRVRVLERVVGGEVRVGRRTRPLAATRPVTHAVSLRRSAGVWRVARVVELSGSASGPHAARR